MKKKLGEDACGQMYLVEDRSGDTDLGDEDRAPDEAQGRRDPEDGDIHSEETAE